jgi:hypothetical protein
MTGREFAQIGTALAGSCDREMRVSISQVLAVLASHVDEPDVAVYKVEGCEVVIQTAVKRVPWHSFSQGG